ncbi:unnamed protein product [Fusarium graminearum]|nr:unnamed protein product [Fusarium graminearum]
MFKDAITVATYWHVEMGDILARMQARERRIEVRNGKQQSRKSAVALEDHPSIRPDDISPKIHLIQISHQAIRLPHLVGLLR